MLVFLDSVNTSLAIKEILNLISACNTYMNTYYNASHYNHVLIRDIALYITRLLTVNIYFLFKFIDLYVSTHLSGR